GINVHRAIVLNINFSAGLRDNALNGLATGPNERPNLLRINFDRLDPWCVLRQLWPRFFQCATHDTENFRARFFCALNRLYNDIVADTRELQIQLKTGDAAVGSAKLEIHIS